MCIRDRCRCPPVAVAAPPIQTRQLFGCYIAGKKESSLQSTHCSYPCLLYTSDAADERSSVDLGGRRIIKKKKRIKHISVLGSGKKNNNSIQPNDQETTTTQEETYTTNIN